MFSSILSSIVFVTLFIGSTIHAISNDSNACNPSVSSIDPCYLSINVPSNCKSSILNLANRTSTLSCKSAEIFWNYLINNLTIVIATSLTLTRQQFSISLDNPKPQISHIYQISNNQETEIKSNGNVLIVKSDEKYQVVLKFQGPPELTFFGVFIRYNVTKY